MIPPPVKKGERVPQIRFNHPLSADRVVGHVRLELQQLKKLEKKYHCTINDIALCVVAGGAREFLNGHNELPAENLVTLMPIDVRRAGPCQHKLLEYRGIYGRWCCLQ
jgi:hypothetical protein